MHSKKVLHRDLKTANVFLNKSATICKLGKKLDTLMQSPTPGIDWDLRFLLSKQQTELRVAKGSVGE